MNRAALLLAFLLACKAGSVGDPPARRKAEPEHPASAQPAADDGQGSLLPPPAALPDDPLGLPSLEEPEHNPTTAAKVALGEVMFFDARLSQTQKTSCSTCHQPEHGYSQAEERSKTDAGKPNARHTPTLWNSAYASRWSWDGTMPLLESQIMSHWRGQLDSSPAAVVARLATMPAYDAHFQRAFGGPPTAEAAVEALASFVRTRVAGNSPWDRYEAGDRSAVSAQAIAGFEVFRSVAQCAQCHAPPLYSDHRFHALGITDEKSDPGHMRATNDPADRGAFRTPTLRGLVHTAPYLHDGSAATLEAVIERKVASGILTGNRVVDTRLAASRLSAQQRTELLAFLRALSRPTLAPKPRPTLPVEPPPATVDAGAGDDSGPSDSSTTDAMLSDP